MMRCLSHLTAAVLLFGAGLAAPTAAQELEARADRLTLSFDAAGGFDLAVLDANGERVGGAEGVGLFLDGALQRDWEVTSESPLVFENAAVRVAAEPVNDRALAVTWTALDSAEHDFDLRLLSTDETRYYGTGERFNALNQRGYILPLAVDDRYRNKGVGSHKPIPFFMSTQGFGVWVDSFAQGVFDLSGTERFVTSLRFPERSLRVVFFAGPSLAEILEAYTGVTGRTRVPPPWAFGLWKSRDVHPNRDSVLVDVEKLRRHDIPASVLVLDSPWATGYNDFVVNAAQFDDPASMFERIDALGFNLCLWLTPYVNVRNVQDAPGLDAKTATFDDAHAAGYLATNAAGEVALTDWWKGTGGLVDFTNPDAVAWWHSQLSTTKAYGADAFKVDGGEGNFVPTDAQFFDGTPADVMRNRYAALYDSVMQAYVDEHLGGDGVLLSRSGTTGTQRYPFDWAGDNRADFSIDDGLPSVILAGQNAALSGIALWGSDIAGYVGVPTKEVFIRWTQATALSPFMQVHMTSNLGPWDFDAETLAIFRRYARLRTTLFPYLYDAVHEAARTGMPVVRPMALAFEGDNEAAKHRYQFLVGPDLLVAPIYQSGTHRAVYFPEGTWIDYWTGEETVGPQLREQHAPLDVLPLFVRAGTVLLALPDDVDTLVERHAAMADSVVALDDRRALLVWPGGGSSRVETWDGIVATLEDGRLTVDADRARPLEVRLLFREVDVSAPDDATVRFEPDARHTVVSWPMLDGAATLTWTDLPSSTNR